MSLQFSGNIKCAYQEIENMFFVVDFIDQKNKMFSLMISVDPQKKKVVVVINVCTLNIDFSLIKFVRT